jgi:hypothetical protein
MRKILLILLLISQYIYGEQLENTLRIIEQQYYSNEPDFKVVRDEVRELNRTIAQRTHSLKKRTLWWENPANDLILELENIADILAPYESMLIDLAYYEGIQQGHASTLTTLLNTRPTSSLKAGLENYLFEDYSRQIPAKSLLALYELNLADEMLYKRLFREIADDKYRSEKFYTLRLLCSRKEPVDGLDDALLDVIRKRVSELDLETNRDILELSDTAMAYSKMIDGMGIAMISVASELEKIVLTIINSPHADEALAIYPNIEEYIGLIIERVRKNRRSKVPPRGYGLVIDQGGSVSLEPFIGVAEVIEEVTAPEPAIEEPAKVVVTESVGEDVEQSFNWPAWQADRWLWLIGAVVVVGGVFLLRPRK